MIKEPSIDKKIPWAFFDGESQGDSPLVGCGSIMHILEEVQILIKYGLGHYSNNEADSSELWVVLKTTMVRKTPNLQIIGD